MEDWRLDSARFIRAGAPDYEFYRKELAAVTPA